MAKKRKMSALQRKYFGKKKRRSKRSTPTMAKRRSIRTRARRAVRRVRTYARKAYRKTRGFLAGFLPLGMTDSLIAVGVGASLGFVGSLLSPVTNFLSDFLGNYANEASLLLVSAVVYKMGSGFIKTAAREYYRAGLMSLGTQLSNDFLGGGSSVGGSSDLIGG